MVANLAGAKMTSIPSSEKQPVRVCGTRSADICPHGTCRICSACVQCDHPGEGYIDIVVRPTPAAAPEYPFTSVRLGPQETSSSTFQLRKRVAYLQEIGIAWNDMADASRSFDELRSDCCLCHRRKRVMHSFCSDCFGQLPVALQQNLNLHLKHGYLIHIREAWRLLAALRVQCNANQ